MRFRRSVIVKRTNYRPHPPGGHLPQRGRLWGLRILRRVAPQNDTARTEQFCVLHSAFCVLRSALLEVFGILLDVHNGIGVAGLFGGEADEVVLNGDVDISGTVAGIAAA